MLIAIPLLALTFLVGFAMNRGGLCTCAAVMPGGNDTQLLNGTPATPHAITAYTVMDATTLLLVRRAYCSAGDCSD